MLSVPWKRGVRCIGFCGCRGGESCSHGPAEVRTFSSPGFNTLDLRRITRHPENVPGSASAEPARSLLGRKKARSQYPLNQSQSSTLPKLPINPNLSTSPTIPTNSSSCLGSVFSPSRSSTLPSVRPIATRSCDSADPPNSEALLALLRCRYVNLRSSPDETVPSTSLTSRARLRLILRCVWNSN